MSSPGQKSERTVEMVLIATTLSLSIITAVLLVTRSWRLRHTGPAVTAVAISGTGAALWCLPELLSLLVTDTAVLWFLRLAIFPGITMTVLGFYCLVAGLADRSWRPSRRLLPLLSIEPVYVLVCVLTNPWHHLFMTGLVQLPSGVWASEWGPLFEIHGIYSHLLVVIGLIRLAVMFVRRRGHRWTYGLVLLGYVPGTVLNQLWLFKITTEANYSVVGTTLGLIINSYAVWRERYSHAPVATDRILSTVEDVVAVVDEGGVVIEANGPARDLARHVFPTATGPLVGRDIGRYLRRVFRDREMVGGHTLINPWRIGRDLHLRVSRLTDRAGRPIGWTFIIRDITELNQGTESLRQANRTLAVQLATSERLKAEMAEIAIRDPLTDLYNRRFLMERLEMEIAEWRDRPMAVAVIDIDRFKKINDTFGHDGGDQVLTGFSRMIARSIRTRDLFARYGGEEFVLVMPGNDPRQTHRRLDRIREMVASTPVEVSGLRLTVTFSAGVAELIPGDSATSLLKAADLAMYRAKANGRNRVELADRTATPRV